MNQERNYPRQRLPRWQTKYLGFRLPLDLYALLRDVARAERMTVSTLIRMALTKELDRWAQYHGNRTRLNVVQASAGRPREEQQDYKLPPPGTPPEA